MTTTIDGLYALASLTGAPLADRDRQVLGLPVTGAAMALAIACDGGRVVGDEAGAMLLGHIDDVAALAARLGLTADTAPIEIARAALARFGDAAPAHLPGEWSYLDWDADRAMLTLMASDTLRDRLMYATDGHRVAVAPHVRTLAGLDWIDRTPDTAGLLLHMGRADLRRAIGDRTMLRDVRQVTAGTVVRISRSGVAVGARTPLPAPVPWRGSFDDAIDALDTMLRQICREQAARHPARAVLLSGGLDSSLMAAFAATQGTDRLVALTSVAPAGSGLPDEAEFSRAVADAVGIGMRGVVPDAAADVYRPSDRTLRWGQHPQLGPRHYLYEALYDAAVDAGATGAIDAGEGEWSVTGYPDGLGRRQRMRDWLKARLTRLAHRSSLQDAFHVRLSAPATAAAAPALEAALQMPPPPPERHGRGAMWGYASAIERSLGEITATPVAGVRRLLPLRDRRLLTLFAGMPYRFLVRDGVNRAPARALLAGKIPDAVRLRTRGLPFSPDYRLRIRQQAQPARARLPGYARAGVGEWLDLDWLDGALAEIAARPDVSIDRVFQAQLTAMAAAFLAHWLEDWRPDAINPA